MTIKRVLSGMRPSGKLHLGHFHGVLENWLKLQKEHECFFFVADWHALTTEYNNPSAIQENIKEMVIDWLSVGILGTDLKSVPNSTIFLQSAIKEHAELHLLLSMITPLSWLERNPTYKEQVDEVKDKDLHTYGFLGYPVLQTADIIIYKANMVPVGIDQAPHLELSREITRRFNFLYGETFPEPQTLLTETPKLLGTDGRKMSKSYNNAIFLSDPPDVIEKKLLPMFTDPARQRRTDKGNPEVCPVYFLHKIYSIPETITWVEQGCKTAGIGCIECKKSLIPSIVKKLEPIQKKRAEIVKNPDIVNEALNKGNKKALKIAQETMTGVRKALKLQ
ncbi:MAG: tryptophan--tRNA ligase [Deltaproteobacteria bacterium RIFCSPLOWO2_12_FULL_43_16]|nr:MAG: tryptophan--tRNA ligase [Deltaproteobacteria bacterium GWA2_43_19]OGQ09642.1 MAG: tryptophan--tRNA ligase [Deltaproteobacteria bacterium RIFCSPHIGHO2_02_FULL_43_33]OGQ61745.1 MAG: tryptophan--tRNA ligase [Deltaproteobacteria bacterium RIFCSPLOWO2_12_FULL_43_16]HBR17004.1 tryptophan--tRNA ligase [Deltaproteobacteria bacterium]